MEVTTEAVQMFGGMGYMRESARRATDARFEDPADLRRHRRNAGDCHCQGPDGALTAASRQRPAQAVMPGTLHAVQSR
jgi:hypothetical protein